MLDGVMLLWFVLAAASLLFVAVDIRATPESPVLKWGFVLLTAYTGVIGAFLYVLGCREPLPGLHERYTAAQWRQVLGSTDAAMSGMSHVGDHMSHMSMAVEARPPLRPSLAVMTLLSFVALAAGLA